MDGWAKIKPAARYAGICERTMRTWLKQGLRHSRLPSGTVLIQYTDVDQFLNQFATDINQSDLIVADVCNELKISEL